MKCRSEPSDSLMVTYRSPGTAGLIKIVDGEWTRRNVSFYVDGITVLFNGYLRAAFGHFANDRANSFILSGKYIVIRRDLYALK